MKYLRSTTMKAYVIEGRTINGYKGEMLALSDGDFTALRKNKVAASLIDAGAIYVTDKAPKDPSKDNIELTNRNAALILQNTKLQEEKAALEAQLKATGSADDLVKAAIEKQKEEDLAEIKALQAEKDARIAELEEQLKTSKKSK